MSILTVSLDQIEFIPETPYLSKIISYKNDNLWELHELSPNNQKIKIKINNTK